MPFYDNQCPDCNTVWETLQRSGHKVPPCPRCGLEHGVRLLSVNTKRPHAAGNPYDALDTHRDHQVIKSFAHDRRVGGKDTT